MSPFIFQLIRWKSEVFIVLLDAMLVLEEANDGLHELAIAQSFSKQKGMNWFSWRSSKRKVLLANRCSVGKRLPHQGRYRQSSKVLLGATNLVKVHIRPGHSQKSGWSSQPTHQLGGTMTPFVLRRRTDIPTHLSGISSPAFGLAIPARHMVLLLHLAKGVRKGKKRPRSYHLEVRKEIRNLEDAKARLSQRNL